ncbi:MAG: hypothetical protein PHT57_15950 [Rhodoferax sp.]|nr:hypothetical protein [Rhodoferax sp.]
MRAVLGIVSLLLVLATVGLLAKKQLVASPTRVPVVQPASDAPGAGAAAPTAPAATARAQSQQVQQQVQQTVEGLMQQARPMPDGE